MAESYNQFVLNRRYFHILRDPNSGDFRHTKQYLYLSRITKEHKWKSYFSHVNEECKSDLLLYGPIYILQTSA